MSCFSPAAKTALLGPSSRKQEKADSHSSEPFEMLEVMPHVFMSSWPPYIPDNITHTLNVCPRTPVRHCKNGKLTTHWTRPIYRDGELFDNLHLLLYFIKKAVPQINPTPGPITPPSQTSSSIPQPPQRATSQAVSSSSKALPDIPGFEPTIRVYGSSNPRSREPPPETNILIYSEEGRNRAAIAVLAYMCDTLGINVVDAFFMLKEKKHDIAPSESLMGQIQDYMQSGVGCESQAGEEYESIPKEILRRIVEEKRFSAVMEKAESEDWMYESGK
ncbi:hypothetical protein BKA61DRAFT_693719 [Leptodontidium sp. MPI-SDFR-AT-0119]|nr:hypothetical protein BKA61DRAFT_693719 [Leptodontidium sp. MPI-SDFR-AT-0119]